MDEWQHKLESSIIWDAGDVLLVDVNTHSFPDDFIEADSNFRTSLHNMPAGLGRGSAKLWLVSGTSLEFQPSPSQHRR